MKVANYCFAGSDLNNIGDNLQLLALDYIYSQMGISDCEIVQIDKNQLASYDGEYVVLPINMPLVDYVEGGIAGRFSKKIIPVFLGLTLLRDFLYPEEVQYLSSFTPIGCRDERTLSTLRRYNLLSYLNGCITALLPDANIDRSLLSKVFLVDIPNSLLPYIPQNLLLNAQYETHLRAGSNVTSKQIATLQYNLYKQEASLVITSLLHCSIPCMAAGIPVILAKTSCSYRFGWLEKLLPIYTKERFNNIDWKPMPIRYEQHKQHLLNNAISQITNAMQRYENVFAISTFYEQRTKNKYIVDSFNGIKNRIDAFWDKEKSIDYAVWGLTQITEMTINYINEAYPLARLTNIYDKKQDTIFNGQKVQPPKNIVESPKEFIIVTTVSARQAAHKLFEECNRKSNSYIIAEIVI